MKEENSMRKFTKSLPQTFGGAAILLVLASSLGSAQDKTAEQRGLEIAQEADQRDMGFVDSKSDLKMILRNAHGQQTDRAMRSRTLEQESDGDKALVIFDSPGDVRGTAFLSYTHKEGADDQWLYLPALKRVKRIASSNKSGPFMGSEFAYEDISSQEVEKYTYNYVGEEAFDDREHFVIERDPVDAKSGYTKQVVWLDKEHYRVWKVDFYDRGGAMLKTLVLSGYKQYVDKFWRADRWEMNNHQTGKSTVLEWTDYVFGNDFSEKDFNKNALAKAR
jgi:outer membrane lipoprotein-sorting protein